MYVVVENFCGLKFFKPVSFWFPFVLDYAKEYCTKENLKQIKLVWKFVTTWLCSCFEVFSQVVHVYKTKYIYV